VSKLQYWPSNDGLSSTPVHVPEVVAVQKLDADFLGSAKFAPRPRHPGLRLGAQVLLKNCEVAPGFFPQPFARPFGLYFSRFSPRTFRIDFALVPPFTVLLP